MAGILDDDSVRSGEIAIQGTLDIICNCVELHRWYNLIITFIKGLKLTQDLSLIKSCKHRCLIFKETAFKYGSKLSIREMQFIEISLIGKIIRVSRT